MKTIKILISIKTPTELFLKNRDIHFNDPSPARGHGANTPRKSKFFIRFLRHFFTISPLKHPA